MLPPIRTVAPAAEPVSLALFKEHARVDGSDQDTVIQGYIDGAVSYLDGWEGILGRCIINQTWRQDFRAWEPCLKLPFPKVSDVSSITYYDESAVQQTVANDLYEVVKTYSGYEIWFKQAFTSPAIDSDRAAPISVTFVAGYGADSTSVPWDLRVAIMHLAAHWFGVREAVSDKAMASVPAAFDDIVANYRWRRV